MRTIKLAVNPRGYIIAPRGERLGRAGEIGASRIEFDVSGWTENSIDTYSVAGKNAAGLAWVLESGLTATDGIVSLDVPDALVSTDGYATVEIRGEASGAIIKTAGITLCIEPALTTGAVPTGADPAWIDQLSQAGVALAEQIEGGETLRDEMQGLADQVGEAAQGVAADKVATEGYMQRAETAAEGAEGSAEAAAASLDKLTNLTATAETLSPGSAATVVKTATPDGYALAFGIPRGDTGAKGDKGDTGDVNTAQMDAAISAAVDPVTSQLADIASKDGHSLSQRQAIFGAVWDKGESPILTRLGAMSGATVAPGLDAMPGSVKTVTIDGTEVFGYNRYVAETALFDWPEVTDSYGNVFIRIPKIYLRKIDTPTSLTWYASRMPFDGCYLPKCFWDFENSRELDYVLVGKYKASLSADGLRLESKPDVFPLHSRNIVQFRTLAQANNTGGLKGYQQLDIHVIDLLQTLFVIQNATLNSQSKAAGFTAGQYSATHLAVVAEDGVNRIIVPNATAALYEVGQTIGIGTSQGGQQVAADRLITAIEVYDASNKAVVFDGSPANIAVGNMLYNTAYKNGFSAALASKFASKISATSGKHPFVWQGIESLWGDIWQFVDGVNINNRQAWVCENADQYTSNVFAEPYKQLSYVNVGTDGYPVAMGFDAERPYASFPVSVGGSSSKFYSDHYYQNEGQRIALVGGRWTNGSPAGLFDWDLSSASSPANVGIGGRLLKKPL